MVRKFRFAIDRGGTFTDVYAELPVPPYFTKMKLLSEDPANYADAPREGIRRIIQQYTGKKMGKNAVDSSDIESIRMGTTVATNALLERNGERCALVVTRGFRDILEIGNQSRPKIFDLHISRPELLYEAVVEVGERVRIARDPRKDEGRDCLATTDSTISPDSIVFDGKVEKGTTGEYVEIMENPDLEEVRKDLQKLLDDGINSICIVFMHSYTFDKHEKMVADLATEMGFTQVSRSSEIMPLVRLVSRGHTASVDSYLTPVIKTYLRNFRSGFKDNLAGVDLCFMQSDGGLIDVSSFYGYRAILSGPAGGVVGCARTTTAALGNKPVIGFDMGGTSTDVSRYAGYFDHVFETETAGVTIQAPQLDIATVAAGGGSRLFYRSGMFVVGPESSRAHPGPVCYRKNGFLAVTDANLMLGRILPDYFPKIFGPTEDQPLGVDETRKAFEKLTKEINAHRKVADPSAKPFDVYEVAEGFIRVANESMCRPIRGLTMSKGLDVRGHVLSCFGSASGQHACAIARNLGIDEVYVDRMAGILSAYGMGLADFVIERSKACACLYMDSENSKPTAEEVANIRKHVNELTAIVKEKLNSRGFPDERIKIEYYLRLRYEGTDASLTIRTEEDLCCVDEFLDEYKREYGFVIEGRTILADDVRVRGIGVTKTKAEACRAPKGPNPTPLGTTKTYFAGKFYDTTLYRLEDMPAGMEVKGPAILIEKNTSIIVDPQSHAKITESGGVHIFVGQLTRAVTMERDPIQLSIFGHRFMSIAEQMGRVLQRTAISTNIKERLDFSCALFDWTGGLVANAPHLPVHLGAMQCAVRSQVEYLGDDWKEGEVVLSNHPTMGGSHLPDMTVMTPVWAEGRPVFYVACRAHHAEIGGIAPGSMPPFSKSLSDEGACIKSLKIVKNGVFQEAAVVEALMAPGTVPRASHEQPVSGSRCIKDNLSDFRSQVASNQKGIELLQDLIRDYSLPVVKAYMQYVQDAAEGAVRDMLQTIAEKRFGYKKSTMSSSPSKAPTRRSARASSKPTTNSVPSPRRDMKLHAEDFMDDGSKIALTVTIDPEDWSAHFDFSGTSEQVYGNTNAPEAVTSSAVIYCLRCMVDQDIPLNQGCLVPVKIALEESTLLKPSPDAAVVGGNVLTSQRIVDVVFKAFRAAAASQGCTNNFTFGGDNFGYYETIAGGAGAGSTWDGASGVHTHMTNTRITDAEVLERRYPVILRRFSLRRNSGGAGLHRGGDGVVREVEFLVPITASILSERRVFHPYGLEGGDHGQTGLNLLVRTSGQKINLGAKNTLVVQRGERLMILTPGGGGWGRAEDAMEVDEGAGASVSAAAAAAATSNAAVARKKKGKAGRRKRTRQEAHMDRLDVCEAGMLKRFAPQD